MLLIIKKVFFLVGLTLFVIRAHSQIVSSTRNGVWTDPATWGGGTVPSSVNATQIIIDHQVEIPDSLSVLAFRVVVNNTLTLMSGATLEILPDLLPAVPDFLVSGTLICEDSSFLMGTSVSNTRFDSGSVYVHKQGPLGFLPYGSWDANSTLVIAGFTTSGYINIAHSDSWKQSFGNVVYDCPLQTIFAVDLNGYLSDIQGDFVIMNTNSQSLRLSTTQNPVINVGGDLIVEGPSEVWFCTTGIASVIDITGDFIYRSTSLGSSYLTTRGRISVNVGGDFVMESTSPLRMTSSAVDSLDSGRLAELNVSGSVNILSGSIVAPPLGSGVGRIVFSGSGTQFFTTPVGVDPFQGNLDYEVDTGSVVDLGVSVLSNTTGNLTVSGKILVGSPDPMGAIQLDDGGNIQVHGQRIFDPGATIEYNGLTSQVIGNGHPDADGVNLICSNDVGVEFLQSSTIGGDIHLKSGILNAATLTVIVGGDVVVESSAAFQLQFLRLIGALDQQLSMNGAELQDLSISKTANTKVTLVGPLSVRGILVVESPNTELFANGYLTLISVSDQPGGSGCVGPLSSGAAILGDVTVQRHMSGEGRIYRYISSPVIGATVASLMDDFPITGVFLDPSTGSGIRSKVPSFYFYDESVGGLQAGWTPYPKNGNASMNPLAVGVGYAAFIRKGAGPTVWDVTGVLNQGDISLPVAFTPQGEPSNGWNLVGNPYPCAIDWDIDGTSGWTKNNISNVISIRDNGDGGGTFHYWDGDVNYHEILDGKIAAGQSFWVRATAVDPELVIREGTKAINGAEFFRRASQQIPSFSLTLSRGNLSDRAFFKIRPDADDGIDDWDAIKLDNEQFDMSILSEVDSLSLAIYATNVIPCGSRVFQIISKDLVPGSYQLTLLCKFDMKNFRYTLVDQFIQKETLLTPGEKITLDVSTDVGSLSWDRFILRLDEAMTDVTLDVEAGKHVCPDTEFPVFVKQPQAGIWYSVRTVAGQLVTGEKAVEEGDILLMVDADLLHRKMDTLIVMARTVCSSNELAVRIPIKVEPGFEDVEAIASPGCPGTPAMLSIPFPQPGYDYYWFESASSPDMLATGFQFFTPPLTAPTTYFVAALRPDGCISHRYPTYVERSHYDFASIGWVDSLTLSSNYASNNQWYLNGTALVDEVNQYLQIWNSGKYSVEISMPGCTLKDTIVVNRAGYSYFPGSFRLYPNPVRSSLIIEGNGARIVEVEIIDELGRCVDGVGPNTLPFNGRKAILNTSGLRPGVYIAHIRGDAGYDFLRFVKTE